MKRTHDPGGIAFDDYLIDTTAELRRAIAFDIANGAEMPDSLREKALGLLGIAANGGDVRALGVAFGNAVYEHCKAQALVQWNDR